METISLGQGSLGTTHFADAASEEDDIGGGRIYAALVKQALLKRLNQTDATVAKVSQGGSSTQSITDGASGAIIANTSDKSNIQIQIVCPVGFASALETDIYNHYQKSIDDCYVGTFLDRFKALADTYDVPSWNRFASWFNGYRPYINDSIEDATMRIQTIDGQIYDGICNQCDSVTKISDIIDWAESCMMLTLQIRPTSDIMADNNPEKIGFIIKMSNMGGIYQSYTGKSTATMHFCIRL